MAVDLDAIARRGRCETSSLKIALPLLEQGYTAPFLARYRRDELAGLDEATLWNLKAAVDAEKTLADFRSELLQSWEATPLQDPAIGDGIRKSGSKRTLQRLSKRLRAETGAGIDTDANRLAVRLLNPQSGDSPDPAALAESMESVADKAGAVAGLSAVVPGRLAGDPRVISAAVRWLSRNAKLHISNIHDPHIASEDDAAKDEGAKKGTAAKAKKETKALDASKAGEEADAADKSVELSSESATASEESAADATVTTETSVAVEPAAGDVAKDQAAAEVSDSAEAESAPAGEPSAESEKDDSASEVVPENAEPTEVSGEVSDETPNSGGETAAEESVQPSEAASETPAAAETVTDGTASAGDAKNTAEEELPGFKPDPKADAKPAKKSPKKAPAKKKKVSPRQRRRRWLVSVLKPLEGKRMPAAKLSAFQVVMLGRALRSQVAVCAFEYDAAKLVVEIKRAVVGLNKGAESVLNDLVMQHEADIREAAEAAWWDELHERASARLVSVAADHLRDHVNRGPVEAKVVMAIDAVGPKTAATAIVSSDGRVLQGEDIPCQLTGNVRSQSVAKMGELIHQHNVDLVVISNGPARRACLIALGDLIGQSPANSIRWTVADRSGADTYSSSDVANSEMRSTPRRFRAAAWVAFSVLHPAQAYAKVDPLRLRLASFQSELSDDALSLSLGNIMASGASRGGVDANAAPAGWLKQLPGMNADVANSIVRKRETDLLKSRQELVGLEGWTDAAQMRQAMPFLRIFESEESLDGTLIHPDDYALAKKLATSLEIELPPASPPSYQAPIYNKPADEPKLVDATTPVAPAAVEDFDNAGEKAGDFEIPEAASSSASDSSLEDAAGETAEDAAGETMSEAGAPAASEADSTSTSAAATPSEAGEAPAVEAGLSEADASAKEAQPDVASEASAGGESDAKPAGDAEADRTAPESDAKSEDIPDPIRRPRPEQPKVDKCIKEWQVGKHRVNQLVGWLCDPFGETAISNDPPAVLDTMPTLKTLQPGDQVIGVVVGVMSFGVFVELAPDCSGLVHVSRLSDGFVEDLNEAIQVGDVVTAWVTGIDEKRRRVGLSALSPAQEQKMEQERQQRSNEGGRGGYGRGGQNRGGQNRGGQNRGGQNRGGQAGGQGAGQGSNQGRGGQNRGGQGSGGQGGQGGGGQGGGQRAGGGRGGQQGGRGGQGGRGRGGRPQGRGGRGQRQPESYRVVAKPEAKPISDEMKKGDEPLRSFGDLMQFYSGGDEPKEVKKKEGKKKKPAAKSEEAKSEEAKQESGDQAGTAATPAEANAAPPVVTDPVPAASPGGSEAVEPSSNGGGESASSETTPDNSGGEGN